jgi:hypothetical protein
MFQYGEHWKMDFLKKRKSTWQHTSRVTELEISWGLWTDCDTHKVTVSELLSAWLYDTRLFSTCHQCVFKISTKRHISLCWYITIRCVPSLFPPVTCATFVSTYLLRFHCTLHYIHWEECNNCSSCIFFCVSILKSLAFRCLILWTFRSGWIL